MPPSAAAAIAQMSIGVTSLSSGEFILAVAGLLVETVSLFVFAIYWARRTVQER
jgi:hypothetical protein